ncbi:hypothetical protein AQUCO_13300024v1 [Aquilegia coerulea]|uniref:Serine carboxypeptidase S28 family protein n=1 Tax=Aquilegia coerulea TaxID=218851 RepID=A0A2G5C1B1_AQUCA|nr:hypothetical protein AQUCO_13300024v1 [Aquilegia coerulea]
MMMSSKRYISKLLLSLILIFLLSIPITAIPSRSPSRFLGNFAKHHKTTDTINKTYRYDIRYFTQTLDHFSFSNLPTFQQRYLISTDHWLSGGGGGLNRFGPIFVYCGNEGDIEWFASNTGFLWEIASTFGALIVFPEHRYYGESMPYGSREKAYKNANSLSYLTAEQALADYAVFITDLKRNLSAEASPVVLFGGSYGGMLAAWMRLKYPHIAIGALASSAPILQFEDIVPTETFYDIVSNDFRRESLSCFDAIKKSWEEIEVEGKKENGLLQLTKKFHLCQSLNSTEDLSDWLDSAYSYLAMVDYPYPSSFLMPLPANPIKEIDSYPEGTSILERVFAGVSIYYNYTGTVDCFDLADDPHGMSGWDWQACTEMVMPMSSSRNNSMFPTYNFNYTSYQEQCVKEFGIKPRPRWITTEFGGHDMRTSLKMFGSNIIFSNGLLDPWSGGGVLQNLSETIVALVSKEGAHHIDLRASTDDDPDWLVEQRKSEIKLIKSWIKNYYQEKIGHFST